MANELAVTGVLLLLLLPPLLLQEMHRVVDADVAMQHGRDVNRWVLVLQCSADEQSAYPPLLVSLRRLPAVTSLSTANVQRLPGKLFTIVHLHHPMSYQPRRQSLAARLSMLQLVTSGVLILHTVPHSARDSCLSPPAVE